MNAISFIAILVAIFLVLLYIFLVYRSGNQPELGNAIIIFLGANGLFGAIKLVGFVLFGHYVIFIKLLKEDSIWILAAEDATILVIGGIALGWVSVKTILESYSIVFKKTNNLDRAGEPAPKL